MKIGPFCILQSFRIPSRPNFGPLYILYISSVNEISSRRIFDFKDVFPNNVFNNPTHSLSQIEESYEIVARKQFSEIFSRDSTFPNKVFSMRVFSISE